MMYIPNRIKRLIKKYLFIIQRKKLIKRHRLSPKTKREARLWQYPDQIKWTENQDYVLYKPNDELNPFERQEKEVLAAEYGVCQEIATLGGAVLDNGCGTGRCIDKIMQSPVCRVKKIIGVDIAIEFLKRAAKKSIGGGYFDKLDLHLASADNLFFIPDCSIDFAIAMYRTFGNLSDEVKEKNLQEMKRVLKKNGYYILSLGNKKFMSTIVEYYQKFSGAPKYYNLKTGDVVYGDGIRQRYLTKKEIVSFFRQRGFAIKKIYGVGANFIVWLSVQ